MVQITRKTTFSQSSRALLCISISISIDGALGQCLFFVFRYVFISKIKNLWSIKTELEQDREQELELNQYYANPFTLQWEPTHCTSHHKFSCKVTMLVPEWVGNPFPKFPVPAQFHFPL